MADAMRTNPTRRAFLGGLVLLSTVPAIFASSNGLTPLEAAIERLRRAYTLMLWQGAPASSGFMPAIQPLRDLRLPPDDFKRAFILARRLGRRDYAVLCSRSTDPRAQRLLSSDQLKTWMEANGVSA